MRSVVREENLCEETIRRADGVLLGEFNKKGLTDKEKEAWDYLVSRQLVGRFDGLDTFFNYMEKNEGKFGGRKPEEDDSSKKNAHNANWVTYKTYDEYYRKATKTPEVFRKFTESDIRLKDYDNSGNDVSYETTGDFLDIGRVMTGEPECFGVMREGSINRSYANIIVNLGCPFYVDREVIDCVAMRTVRLIDMLEFNHIRCQVTVISSDDNGHLEIVLKHYGSTLNLNDLCVCLSSDFFRRSTFLWREHSQTLEPGYGHTERIPQLDLLLDDDDIGMSIVVDNHYSSDNPNGINRDFNELERTIEENNNNGKYEMNYQIFR